MSMSMTDMHSKQPSPPLPKRKRPVVVSLPPRKSIAESNTNNREQQASSLNGCKCCNNSSNNSNENSEAIEAALFLQLAHQLDSADHCHPLLPKRPPLLKMEPSTESCRPTTTANAPADTQTHEKHQSDPASPAPNNNNNHRSSTVYDDPAILHVIEHAKIAYDCHTNNNININDCIHRPSPPPASTGATTTTTAITHETHCCPLQCGNRSSSPPKTCQDRIWHLIAKKVDQQVDARIRSVFYPGYRDDQKLEELEVATARLDRRLLALEAQQQQQQQAATRPTTSTALRRRQSMPPAANRTNSSNNHYLVDTDDEPETARRLIALSSQTARLEAEKATLQSTAENLRSALQKQKQDAKQLQRECQGLYQRLAEEQKRSKQLEQQHVEFHKRQTSDMLKMDQMQRRIRQLEAELSSNNTNSNTAKLPTPRSSPPSSTQLSSHNSSSNSSCIGGNGGGGGNSSEGEEDSVKEEDGYLVFNTNINGELIHCRVKIPSSAATSMRSSPIIRRRAVDFPLALVSPPITRAGSPKALVPPLPQKKKGLNPNAPEWRIGGL